MPDAMPDHAADYDNPWKEALDYYFEPFLLLVFPHIWGDIDWQRGYESLDKELQRVVRDAETGKRHADKLLKVWLQDGQETWVLIHVEVQSQVDSDFAERMFTYHYRIFDRYHQQVVSLAVLGDESPTWRPQGYGYDRWGCSINLTFPIVKLLDYCNNLPLLETSDNPFAVVVLAHLQSQMTRRDLQTRFEWKRRLVLGLYERGYSRENILELFRLIDWMMTLPDALEQELRDTLHRYQEEKRMPYITSFERLAKEEERQEMITSVLEARFGELDEELRTAVAAMTKLSPSELTPFLLHVSREELIERFGHPSP